jgi:hypothetical protein
MQHNLAVTYRGAGRPDDARRTFLDRLASARAALPSAGLPLAAELTRAGADLLTVAGAADAEPILWESVGLYRCHDPDGWRVFNAQALLGAALLARQKYGDAEPHLTTGYAGLVARKAVLPPRDQTRLAEVADRLVDLYTRWGKPGEVKKWQAERAKYPPEQAPPPRAKK